MKNPKSEPFMAALINLDPHIAKEIEIKEKLPKDAVVQIPRDAKLKLTHNELKAADHIRAAIELLEADSGKTTAELAATHQPTPQNPPPKPNP